MKLKTSAVVFDIDRNSKLAVMLNVDLFLAAVVLGNDIWGLYCCIIMLIQLGGAQFGQIPELYNTNIKRPQGKR